MIYPEKLNKGDTVGIVCPSSPISEERVTQCISTLENMGYKVKTAGNLALNYGGYMAGDGKVRGDSINQMFADPEVKAVFCVRGGDAGTRAVEYIDLNLVKNNPKIFVGYSDITSFHILFNQEAELVTFHGPMVSSNMVDSFDDDTRTSLFNAINGDKLFEFKNPEECEIEVLRDGKASGKVIGGNLSLLSASIGTPYELDTKGKILFFEEVCEPVTKIEKWAYHLRNSGKFNDCTGILLGQFTDIDNKYDPSYDVFDCLKDIFRGLDVPIMANIQSGHGEKIMTIPFGAECTLDTSKKSIVFRIDR